MSGPQAVLAAMLPSLLENGWLWLRRRRMDVFGLLMLGTSALGAALALLGGGEKLLLMRESFVTGAVGAAFLGSLLFPKPIVYYLNQRFLPHRATLAEERWTHPYTRFVFRCLTFIWGVMLAAEAAVRATLAVRLSAEAFLAVSHVVLNCFLGAAALWTYLYRRHAMRKLARLLAEPASRALPAETEAGAAT